MQPLCYIVNDGISKEAALQHISSAEAGELRHDGKESLLELRFSSSDSECPTVMERALRICRQQGEFSKWNVLHLSEADSLRAIQLCIAERMKQECGEFCAQASDVLAVHQRRTNSALYDGPGSAEEDLDSAAYRRYLSAGRLADSPAVVAALRRLAAAGDAPDWRRPVLVTGRPASLLERAAAELLTGGHPVTVREVTEAGRGASEAETGLQTGGAESGSGEAEAEPGQGTGGAGAMAEEAEAAPGLDSGGAEPQLELVRTVWHCVELQPPTAAQGATSHTDAHIRSIFIGLLRLLVNSRDELALAAACQAPGLELSGPDFLAIRRAARAAALPMYQTVVSHVRRVELGGANYQPSSDCPLHGCTAPLAALVRLLSKLHDTIEEEADPGRCCLRLVAAARAAVARGPRLRPAAVEREAARLRQTVTRLAALQASEPPDPAVLGGPAVQLVRQLCDRESCSAGPVTDHLSVLEDSVTSPGTPGRRPAALPSVISLFRTPPEADCQQAEDGVGLPLEERLRRRGIARPGQTPTTTKRSYGTSLGWLAAEQAAGRASDQEETPPLVAGPTLVCSRSGCQYAAGEGLAAYRQLQAADRARPQGTETVSPKTSKAPKKPKRSLFDAAESAKTGSSKPPAPSGAERGAAEPPVERRAVVAVGAADGDTAAQRGAGRRQQSAPAAAAAQPARKKRRTEAALDQENLPAADVTAGRPGDQQPRARTAAQGKAKPRQIRQVSGQKSIRDFFRI